MNSVAADASAKATETSRPEDRVSGWLAAGWGFGSMATATMLNAPTAALLFFLVTVIKLDPLSVGALIFAGKIIDVLTDPPIGALSDKTQSRLGEAPG